MASERGTERPLGEFNLLVGEALIAVSTKGGQLAVDEPGMAYGSGQVVVIWERTRPKRSEDAGAKGGRHAKRIDVILFGEEVIDLHPLPTSDSPWQPCLHRTRLVLRVPTFSLTRTRSLPT